MLQTHILVSSLLYYRRSCIHFHAGNARFSNSIRKISKGKSNYMKHEIPVLEVVRPPWPTHRWCMMMKVTLALAVELCALLLSYQSLTVVMLLLNYLFYWLFHDPSIYKLNIKDSNLENKEERCIHTSDRILFAPRRFDDCL